MLGRNVKMQETQGWLLFVDRTRWWGPLRWKLHTFKFKTREHLVEEQTNAHAHTRPYKQNVRSKFLSFALSLFKQGQSTHTHTGIPHPLLSPRSQARGGDLPPCLRRCACVIGLRRLARDAAVWREGLVIGSSRTVTMVGWPAAFAIIHPPIWWYNVSIKRAIPVGTWGPPTRRSSVHTSPYLNHPGFRFNLIFAPWSLQPFEKRVSLTST